MIDALSGCFEGSFGSWRDVYRLRQPGEAGMPGTALLDPDVATELVDRFSAGYPGADRRAVVSLWTQWYFGAVMVPASAALLLIGRELPVALDELHLSFGADGRLTAVLVGGCAPSRREGRFLPLLEVHLAPLIHHLAAIFPVSPRLLWTNAAAVLDWTLAEAGAAPCAAACRELGRHLSCHRTPCGQRNPMGGAVHHPHEGEGPVRRRRTCCLRYRLPGVAFCGSLCPLPGLRAAAVQG